MESNLEAAKALVKFRGFAIFPVHFITKTGVCSCSKKKSCSSQAKHPMTKKGFKDASKSLKQVERWWKVYPNANIGIRTGKESKIIVIDTDLSHNGVESFQKLCLEHPLEDIDTLIANSGGGGKHYYFKMPEGKFKFKKEIAPGIDIKAEGGCITAPPSIHKSGKRYEWFDQSKKIKEAPKWLIDLIIKTEPLKEQKKFEARAGKLDLTDSDVREMLSHIDSMPGHDIWTRIVWGVTDYCGPVTAKQLIEEWSPDYKTGGHYLDTLIKNSSGKTTIGTVIKYAQDGGYKLPKPVSAKPSQQNSTGRSDDKKKPPSFIEMVISIRNKRDIFSDKFGSIYEYQKKGKYFRELTKHEVYAYALNEDWQALTSKNRREEVYSLLRTEAHHPTLHESWRNISPYQVPVQNGVIDIQSEKLLEHDIMHYLESVIETNWVPGAVNPQLEEFLQTTFEDDPVKIETLQEFAGYSLMPCASAKKALFAIGPSNTGKSVTGHLLANLHGNENVSSISIKQMNDHVALSELVGKSLNIVPEIEVGEAIPDSIFKTLVGTEEAISIRKLYVGFVKYKPYAKHIFLCNNMPIIKDPSNGTINRIVPLEFINVVPEFKMDMELPKKILANKEGLLNWCIEGALRLLSNNFKFTLPQSSTDIIKSYKKANQTFAWFVNQFFVQNQASKVWYEEAWSLLERVRDQGDTSSELHSIRSKKKFSEYLKYLNIKTGRVPDPNKSGGKKQVIWGLARKPGT